MKEREYVETIRKDAQTWIEAMDDEGKRCKALEKWEMRKSLLSPWTAIELCDAWLEKEVTE